MARLEQLRAENRKRIRNNSQETAPDEVAPDSAISATAAGSLQQGLRAADRPNAESDTQVRQRFANQISALQEKNKTLRIRCLPKDVPPTHFLVAMNSALHGAMSRRSQWRIGNVQMIAMSRYRGKEETLLLLAARACVRTIAGVWTVTQESKRAPRLTLLDELKVAMAG